MRPDGVHDDETDAGAPRQRGGACDARTLRVEVCRLHQENPGEHFAELLFPEGIACELCETLRREVPLGVDVHCLRVLGENLQYREEGAGALSRARRTVE